MFFFSIVNKLIFFIVHSDDIVILCLFLCCYVFENLSLIACENE